MATTKPIPTASKRILNIQQILDEYGGTETLWRTRIWRREIPIVKIGRKFFIQQVVLDEFIERNTYMADGIEKEYPR